MVFLFLFQSTNTHIFLQNLNLNGYYKANMTCYCYKKKNSEQYYVDNTLSLVLNYYLGN